MASREKRLSSAEKEALLLYVLLQEDAFLEEMDQKRQQLVRAIKLLDECEMVSRNGFNEMYVNYIFYIASAEPMLFYLYIGEKRFKTIQHYHYIQILKQKILKQRILKKKNHNYCLIFYVRMKNYHHYHQLLIIFQLHHYHQLLKIYQLLKKVYKTIIYFQFQTI